MLRLGGKRLRRLLPVGRVELGEIAGNALLQLRAPPLHLALREVLVAVVDRLELAAVDGHARRGEQAHLAAQLDEARAHLAQRRAVVLAEVGDRLVVGHEAPQQPQQLQIAPGLALEPPARLHAVEIAVDVELQENRRVEGGPARSLRARHRRTRGRRDRAHRRRHRSREPGCPRRSNRQDTPAEASTVPDLLPRRTAS